MDESRITKRVFNCDYRKGKCWSKQVKDILCSVNLDQSYVTKDVCELRNFERQIVNQRNIEWNNLLVSKPKLRTYVKFKSCIKQEQYIFIRNRKKRSLLAQFRLGILPLNIETGRFRNVPADERLCEVCNDNLVENEFHFVCICTEYENVRQRLFGSIQLEEFNVMPNEEKFVYLVKFEHKKLSEYIEEAWNIRKNILYQLL
jgi:hypothetical protein